MKKLTAVESLVNELTRLGHNFKLYKKEIKQAKELEKEQIVDAYIECWMADGGNGNHKIKEAEDYYDATFNQPKS